MENLTYYLDSPQFTLRGVPIRGRVEEGALVCVCVCVTPDSLNLCPVSEAAQAGEEGAGHRAVRAEARLVRVSSHLTYCLQKFCPRTGLARYSRAQECRPWGHLAVSGTGCPCALLGRDCQSPHHPPLQPEPGTPHVLTPPKRPLRARLGRRFLSSGCLPALSPQYCCPRSPK